MDIFDKAAKAADAELAIQKIKNMERANAKAAEEQRQEEQQQKDNASRAFPQNPMNGAR